MAPRILHIQRTALLPGGPDLRWNPAGDDENPSRFYEPLSSRPKVGRASDKAEFRKMRIEYYNAIGWDERGIPQTAALRQLGLDDVDLILDHKIRAKKCNNSNNGSSRN